MRGTSPKSSGWNAGSASNSEVGEPMPEALEIIQLASVAVDNILGLIAKVKSSAGLTDDEVMAEFQQHSAATQQAIAGYLAGLKG
jgi:hypothetical protein